MVFFRFPFRSRVHCVSFDNDITSDGIYKHITSYLGCSDFSLVYNGKVLVQDESVPQDANVLVTFGLPGGKGGFGSMLRAIGAQIEKTTNREACRDLSGRRLRDINEEQRLKKWLSKESEREAEKVRRRKERIERLKSKPKHNFNDFEYEKKLSEWPERVDDGLTAGMEKRNKRPAQEASCSAVRPKKKHLWLDEDISCSSDSEPETRNSDSREATSSDSCPAAHPGEAGCSTMSDDLGQDTSLHTYGEATLSSDSSDAKPPQEEKVEIPHLQEEPMDVAPSTVDENALKPEETSLSNSSSSPREKLNEKPHLEASSSANKTTDEEDTSPVDLQSFESPTALECLGLDRLKRALAERGLKCGGNIQDRAQRLWRVKDLQPHQYPSSLLAKKKK